MPGPPRGRTIPGMSTTTTHNNEAAVRACFEKASAGDFAALEYIVTPDYVLHPEDARGPAELARVVQGYREGLADLDVTVEHQFTAGDYVATRTTIRGRHDGELFGHPATGRAIEVMGLTLSRCRDGRIEEEWELIDAGGLLAQIGS